MTAPELLRPATRTALREAVREIGLAAIDDAFRDEGFLPVAETSIQLSTERRQRAQEYLEGIDWTDPAQARRAVRAFERLLRRVGRNRIVRHELLRALEEDGYVLDDNERLVTVAPALHDGALRALRDPSAIREQLARLTRAVQDQDPALVIGVAKDLVESTAKAVLLERAVEFDERRDDLPKLADAAQRALRLHPQDAGGADSALGVKTILGGVRTVVGGLAELRNSHGVGHGPARTPSGLTDRHARLAANAARTWCELLLDTLADAKAPWRQTPPAPPTVQ